MNRRLAARGHDVRAVSFTRGAARDERVDGVRVTRVRPTFVASNTPVRLGHPFQLARLARDADVVVGHGPVPFSLESAAVASALARRPFVATYHAGVLEGGSRILDAVAAANRATLEAFAFRRARRIVAVSPLVVSRALARHARKAVVVPPGVDAAAFSPDGAPEPGRILFVGPLSRAYRWKGVGVLYDAFRAVASRDATARLVLVGDGDLREALAERARRDGLAARVELPGRLPDDGLVDEYRRASVAVLPSTSPAESFGMVLAEANACGTPVVATRLGSSDGFVRDGENGLLVPPGDARALADAVSALLASPAKARAMGERGRDLVVTAHDWDRLAERTEAVLEEAARGAIRPGRVSTPGSDKKAL